MDNFVSLGTVVDAIDTAYSGFAFPARKRVVPLLGDGTSATGNSVLMEGSFGYREATLTLAALTTDEKDDLVGYDESSATVTFTDHDGNDRDVRVLELRAALRPGGTWEASLTLQELSEPVPPGS